MRLPALACALAATLAAPATLRADAELPAPRPALAVGQPFPALHLPPIDGGAPIDPASFRGKKVLLIEFAAW